MNDIVKQTQQLANIITENFVSSLQQTVAAEVSQAVQARLANLDVTGMVRDYVVAHLRNNSEKNLFTTKSIPSDAIDINGLKISADNIENGVIKKFTSTGIEDRASQCQLTILDQGTVFENTLYAPRIEIKGDTVIEGRLIVNGNLPDDSTAFQGLVNQTSNEVIRRIGPNLLEQHQEVLFNKIRQEGVDIGKLKIEGRPIFEGRTLTSAILDSRLESLGVVRDLQSSGETLLSETLYVVNKKVGINTMDPGSTLSLWDEEVEVNLGKHRQHTGKLSVRRDQKLVLGSGTHDNVVLNDDGSTSINKLKIGTMTFGSSASPPAYDAAVGTVIFNENPSLGGPLGWVSLGGARWANFGIID